jgi:hypothetical protein
MACIRWLVATSYGFVYNGLASMIGCDLQMASASMAEFNAWLRAGK